MAGIDMTGFDGIAMLEDEPMSFPTSLIPPTRQFSHEHGPTRVVFFSRP